MLNYNEFVNHINDNILNYLPNGKERLEICRGTIYKINNQKDYFIVNPKGEKEGARANIYYRDFYNEYIDGTSIDIILQKIAQIALYTPDDFIEEKEFLDFKKFKDKIIMLLINKEWNKEYLKTLPHREFLDLAIIYRMVLKSSDNQLYGSVVNYNLLSLIGLSNEEELYDLAKRNMKYYFSYKHTMIENNFCILSNNFGLWGALSMTNIPKIDKLATRWNTDVILLPSSINEIFAVPRCNQDIKSLREVVMNANLTVVEEEERLSNNVYIYGLNSKEIIIA